VEVHVFCADVEAIIPEFNFGAGVERVLRTGGVLTHFVIANRLLRARKHCAIRVRIRE